LRILEVMAGAADGGAETAFVDACIAMAANDDVSMEVVTRQNNHERIERLQAAGIKVHMLPFGGAPDFYTKWAMRRIIKKFQPDIVQTWMSRAAQKIPAWREKDTIPRYLVFSRLGGYYKLGHFQATDYFIAITPDIQRYLEKNGVASERVRHINNFAETEGGAKPADRAALHTPADAPLLVALGRLHVSKAFDVLLQSLYMLPGVYLWIAGEGPERADLEERIEALVLQDRVRMLGWRDDRAALLKAADICVFPSRYEPFGTVFVQAWATRTPLITTASDGPRQFVRDRKNGLVVPVDDPEALAGAIRTLLDNPDLAQALADDGYQCYLHEFTMEKNIEAYLDFYRHALARRDGGDDIANLLPPEGF
jgi:glycosyltransferase involved in cell wall biosynthesis